MTELLKGSYHAQGVFYKDGSSYYGHNITDKTQTSDSSPSTVLDTLIDNLYTAYGMADVYIREGTHDFASTSLNLEAKSNIRLRGAGMDMTKILNGAIINTGTTTTNNIQLLDMTVDANSNRGSCLNLQKVTDMRLTNVKLANSSTSFLFNWSSSDRLIADKCVFSEGGQTGAADNCAGSQIKTTENESVFRHCIFSKASALGGAMLTTGGTGNLLVDGCQFYDSSGNAYGAVSIENSFGTCKEVRIVNCRAFGDWTTGAFMIGNNASNAIDRGLIDNCISTGAQKVQNATHATISNGMIYNSIYGYYMVDNTVAKLKNCFALDTNRTNAASDFDKGGLYANDNGYMEVAGLHVHDTTGFVPRGIRIGNTALGSNVAYVSDCNLVGPFSDSPLVLSNLLFARVRGGNIVGTPTIVSVTTLKINEVNGYVTENNGTATVASGSTSIAVSHGLSYTPSLNEISIEPTNNLGNATKWWKSSPTSSQFTINVDVDPGATTATFTWNVRRG